MRHAPSAVFLAACMTASSAFAEIAPAPRTLVLGGSPESSRSFPTVGALVAHNADSSAAHFLCAGTLLSPTLVVTAAHCLVLNAHGPPEFALTPDALRPTATIAVTRTWIHPDFRIEAGSSTQPLHDLAVVELGEPIQGTAPERLGFESPREGEVLHLVGYGSTILPETSARIENAGDAVVAAVSPLELVVGVADDAQGCRGDSGGPAFLGDVAGAHELVAVVSRAASPDTPCQGGTILTRIDTHRAFIEAVQEAARQPPSGSCAIAAVSRPRRGGGHRALLLALVVGVVLRRGLGGSRAHSKFPSPKKR